MSTPRELARSIGEIVSNARKIRGEKFADVLVILTNLYTVMQILQGTGAPKGVLKLVSNVLAHTTSTIFKTIELTDEECEELSNLMDTISEQADKLEAPE